MVLLPQSITSLHSRCTRLRQPVLDRPPTHSRVVQQSHTPSFSAEGTGCTTDTVVLSERTHTGTNWLDQPRQHQVTTSSIRLKFKHNSQGNKHSGMLHLQPTAGVLSMRLIDAATVAVCSWHPAFILSAAGSCFMPGSHHGPALLHRCWQHHVTTTLPLLLLLYIVNPSIKHYKLQQLPVAWVLLKQQAAVAAPGNWHVVNTMQVVCQGLQCCLGVAAATALTRSGNAGTERAGHVVTATFLFQVLRCAAAELSHCYAINVHNNCATTRQHTTGIQQPASTSSSGVSS
ncbi:hypothetical protein COO60DRAFT_945660 [Scenedesmus sp. NREL 46B-D3]|nr:hypothetical protein COO60DRAFT_945660 [Scenedesmus sp. NREL 46B-D3]